MCPHRYHDHECWPSCLLCERQFPCVLDEARLERLGWVRFEDTWICDPCFRKLNPDGKKPDTTRRI